MSYSARSAIVACLVSFLAAIAPPQCRLTPEQVNQRVEAMLSKLTLEQKIALIGGENNMFIRAEPSIGLPALKMSDGPLGVRTWGPTTGYAAGIGLAASWDPALSRRRGDRAGRARPGRQLLARSRRGYLPLAAQWPQLRVFRRRPLSRLAHRRGLYRGRAEPGRLLHGQALRAQQLRVRPA